MTSVKRRLMSWAVGRQLAAAGEGTAGSADGPAGASTIVVESARQLDAVLASDLAGPQATIFAPGLTGGADDARVVGYEGSFAEPGGEAVLNETFFLQIQSYAISEFMSVVGPTLIRVADAADFAAYLADADRAVAEATFPAYLTNPVIQLADVPALGAGPGADGPRLRLHVRADGQVSTSPGGIALGAVGDGFDAVQAAWRTTNEGTTQPCAVCLDGVLDPAARERELADRPWLPRYLAALDALRNLRARGVEEAKVSGFGARLNPDLAASDPGGISEAAHAPMLLWTGDATYVYDPGSGRTFQTSPSNAAVAELVLARGHLEDLSSRVPAADLARVTDMFAAASLRLPQPTVPVS